MFRYLRRYLKRQKQRHHFAGDIEFSTPFFVNFKIYIYFCSNKTIKRISSYEKS